VPVGYLPNGVRNRVINNSDHLIRDFMLSTKAGSEPWRKVYYIGPYLNDASDAGKVDVVYVGLTETWNHQKPRSKLSGVKGAGSIDNTSINQISNHVDANRKGEIAGDGYHRVPTYLDLLSSLRVVRSVCNL
jgi:hypothetical protein